MDAMKQVLFLCSGNYYRSWFAPHFFNWLVLKVGLPWRAVDDPKPSVRLR
jgi:protein-tyrosine phosphatase